MSEDQAQPRPRRRRGRGLVALLMLAVFAGGWTALYGVVELGEDEVALITRAGRFVRQVEGAGRHLHLPFPVERRAIVSLGPRGIPQGRTGVVTRDGQALEVSYSGNYRVEDARAVRFAIRSPDVVVAAALEDALVELSNNESYESLRGLAAQTGAGLSEAAQRKADARLLTLDAGLTISGLVLGVETPGSLSALEAEIDALAAKRDGAESAARDTREALLTGARTRALELSTDAGLERDALVSKASGEAERFKALAAEYRKAPEVVRTRIYLETMEEILASVRLVIAEPGSSLPRAPAESNGAGAPPEVSTGPATPPLRSEHAP